MPHPAIVRVTDSSRTRSLRFKPRVARTGSALVQHFILRGARTKPVRHRGTQYDRRSASSTNYDLSIFRIFSITERLKLELYRRLLQLNEHAALHQSERKISTSAYIGTSPALWADMEIAKCKRRFALHSKKWKGTSINGDRTRTKQQVCPEGRLPASALSALIVPRHVLGGSGFQAPSDTLRIAGIGVGGMGRRLHQGLQ